MDYTEAEAERLVAEFMAEATARPVKARYPVATENSSTEQGGKILATGNMTVLGARVALVGDIVRYPDGRETTIVSGAGKAVIHKGTPAAVVGSELENGDRINGPMHNSLTIMQHADREAIEGLLDRTYVPLQHKCVPMEDGISV